MNAEKLKYSKARRLVRDGDIVFFQGKGAVSEAIMRVTGCEFSHVELVQWNLCALMSMGATGSGTVYRRLSAIIGEYGKVTIKRLAEAGQERQDPGALPQKAVATALNHLGKPYDFARLAEIWLRTRLELSSNKADWPYEDDSFICSEYVAMAYRAAGVDLAPEKPDRLTTPADLYASPLLASVASFNPEKIHAVK